jgi:hypothetical protein
MKPELNPKPGSKKAIDMGCRCPVLDNNHGAGFISRGEVCYIYNVVCPIHFENNKKQAKFEKD